MNDYIEYYDEIAQKLIRKYVNDDSHGWNFERRGKSELFVDPRSEQFFRVLPEVIRDNGVKKSSGRYPWVEAIYRKQVKDMYLPTKVIFSGPATICFFMDGSKEVVKKSDCDEWNSEKAVLYCIMKHIIGFNPCRSAYYGYFKRELDKVIDAAVKESMKKEPDEWLTFEDVNVGVKDAVASITVGPNGPNHKSCENCKHKLTFYTEEPCKVCDEDWSRWEAKDANND